MTVKACRHFGFDLQQIETWFHPSCVLSHQSQDALCDDEGDLSKEDICIK